MNTELKSLLQSVFDLVAIVEGLAAKKGIQDLFPGIFKVVTDVPAVIANWSDLLPELQKLSDVSADADLLAFVVSQVAGVTSDAHAQKIVSAALDLAIAVGQKGYALDLAIKGQ